MPCVTFDSLDYVFNPLCVCVIVSRGAVWAARLRVRQMRRLPWWASTIATRPCRFALVHSSEITAAPRRASKPAARSEFILLSALCFFFFFFLYQYWYFLRRAPTHRENIIKTPHCFGNVRRQIWPAAWTLILALTRSFALTYFSQDNLKRRFCCKWTKRSLPFIHIWLHWSHVQYITLLCKMLHACILLALRLS